MNYKKLLWRMTIALSVFLAASGNAQQSHQTKQTSKAAAKAPTYQAGLEPRAIDILKAASARLAAARTMSFTAVAPYENPSRPRPPPGYFTPYDGPIPQPHQPPT